MTAKVRAAFRAQSKACTNLGSPFMGQLMALCAENLNRHTDVGGRVLSWPGDPSAFADSVPLRLAGALHALMRQGHAGLTAAYPPNRVDNDALWAAVEKALADEAAFILDRLESPPQTNEVRRSAALIPALHLLSARFQLPIRLIEIGCSAGLNLRADWFHLQAGGTAFGPGMSAVSLRPEWTGTAPVPATPEILERIGIDLNPINPTEDADRLLSYLWPDQPDRIARTEAAITIAKRHPAQLIKGDALEWIRRELHPVPGALTLVFHTIAWQYLPPLAQKEGNQIISAAATEASDVSPIARFAMEAAGPHAALSLEIWPGPGIIPLGRADYHGRTVDWDCATLEDWHFEA